MSDNDWIEWNGGDCPVEEGILVDVRYRDGHVEYGIPALKPYVSGSGRRTAMNWTSSESPYSIIAYRPHRKSEKESVPNATFTMDTPGYERLANVLFKAYLQSSDGKGRDRHAGEDDKPFHKQPILSIQGMVGSGFALGQAIKKIEESQRMDFESARKELLGAIVFIAGAVVHLENQKESNK